MKTFVIINRIKIKQRKNRRNLEFKHRNRMDCIKGRKNQRKMERNMNNILLFTQLRKTTIALIHSIYSIVRYTLLFFCNFDNSRFWSVHINILYIVQHRWLKGKAFYCTRCSHAYADKSMLRISISRSLLCINVIY